MTAIIVIIISTCHIASVSVHQKNSSFLAITLGMNNTHLKSQEEPSKEKRLTHL